MLIVTVRLDDKRGWRAPVSGQGTCDAWKLPLPANAAAVTSVVCWQGIESPGFETSATVKKEQP